MSDDFWNTSSSLKFNFDDEDDVVPNSSNIFNATTQERSVYSIEHVVSKTGLEILLGDITTTLEHVVPPVEETIRKMCLGHRHYLEVYRTLEDKLLLLDEAVKTYDGNVINKIILFLKQTLKHNIFHQQISKRKVAIKHYAHYLINSKQLELLADFYMYTGWTNNIVDLYYLSLGETSSNSLTLDKLKKFISNHIENVSNEQKSDLFENLKFLQWQVANKKNEKSVISQLASICEEQFKNNKGMEEITEFKQLFNIDDFQYNWVIMNTMAKLELWKRIYEHFIKINWFNKKGAFKLAFDGEIFVLGLSKHNPPKSVLEQLLVCISSDRAIYLAEKLQCYKFLITQYVAQKDRLALMDCKNYVPANSEEYSMIEHALRSHDRKWKN